MENIFKFFANTLDGPIYIVVVIFAVILIFACIGFLAERKLKERQKASQYTQVDNNQKPIDEVSKVEVTNSTPLPTGPVKALVMPIPDAPVSPTPIPPVNKPSEVVPPVTIPTTPENVVIATPIKEVADIPSIPEIAPISPASPAPQKEVSSDIKENNPIVLPTTEVKQNSIPIPQAVITPEVNSKNAVSTPVTEEKPQAMTPPTIPVAELASQEIKQEEPINPVVTPPVENSTLQTPPISTVATTEKPSVIEQVVMKEVQPKAPIIPPVIPQASNETPTLTPINQSPSQTSSSNIETL